MAAIGGNTEAARLAGVRVEHVRVIGFAIVGLGAALAGLVLTSQGGQAYPNAAIGLLLPAYAGCFIGAATLRPGVFHAWGTYFGVLFMATIQTGLIVMNYRAFSTNLIQGTVLILAVLLSRIGGRSV
jgi:ribose transport system permease protein